MLLKYFYDDRLAQASYLVGCAATGEALVVDPMRDSSVYLRAAEREGLQITHVTETHIHADFVSGARELAAATGATLYLSDMGDDDWKYAYAGEPNVILVRDGDSWMVGNVRVQVLHTPGHTPEHIAFLITDTAAADRPIGIFTGDFLFVGDVGRPDLLEEAAGFSGTKEPGARRQFETVRRFKALPDYLQIWPGHGAGSACGKSLGAIPSTTLGYEKLFNPAFRYEREDEFVDWLLDGQPEPPRYFAEMKRVNKEGPALSAELAAPPHLDRAGLEELLDAGVQVIDFRPAEAFAEAHLPGTLSIPATETNFSTYVGWFVDYDRPLYLIAPDDRSVEALLTALRAVGVDDVAGYWTPEVIDAAADSMSRWSAEELVAHMRAEDLAILDVRGESEYADLHISGARHIPIGYLPRRLSDIPTDRTVVVQCAGGYRSQIAASLLRNHGFDNVVALADGTDVWSRLLPVESGRPVAEAI
jgi:hydroxyacylglutathione hydrolase